jgi:glycosyltransferase involved in cell wall biosynthesis
MERRGHEVTIVLPANWRQEYFRGRIRPARLRGFDGQLITLRVWKPGSIPLHGYVASPTATLRRVKPDIVYIDQEPYSVAAFQWAIGVRRTGLPALFYTNQNIVKRYPYPFRWTERFVWNSTRGSVVVSEEAGRVLRCRGYRGPLHVVPYSVDLSSFQPVPRDDLLAAELGLRRCVIGYFGRLVPEKGVGVLLEAFGRLVDQSSTSLLVVGSGPLEAAVRSQPGAVLVPGVGPGNVARYLNLVDVLAVPSLTTPRWKEQFGRVIIEALACGVPVVGSQSGEIPHLLASTGGGLVVPEGDADALAAALHLVTHDKELRATYAHRGREAVVSSYSTQHRASRLEAILTEAMARR